MPGLAIDKQGAEGIHESYLSPRGRPVLCSAPFLEHRGSGHFLTFTVLLDHRAYVKCNIFRPLDFVHVRNEVNDIWQINTWPVISERHPKRLHSQNV